MEKRKVVIIDDELPALAVLEAYLARRTDVEVVLSTQDYEVAVGYMEEYEVDVLIVDLDLRTATGYDLMAMTERPTQVIVCTATDNQGSQSTAAGAIDYVVKPIEEERFYLALDKALEQLTLYEDARRNKTYNKTLAVSVVEEVPGEEKKDLSGYRILRVREVVFASADGKLSRVFLADSSELLIQMQFSELQERLDPTKYIRIQRGFIVKCNQIARYFLDTRDGTKNWWVTLVDADTRNWKNGVKEGVFPVGGKYRYRLDRAFAIK